MTDLESIPDSDWCILAGYRGSIAHGTYVPPTEPTSIDDRDLMAVIVPPMRYYLGLHEYGTRGTKERKVEQWDVVAYEARKMVSLLSQGNPNVLSLLWVKPEHIIKATPAGALLIEMREVFVGKHVYNSFVGYAESQIRKIVPGAFKGYMGEKRKGLVEKFGYDTKNAAHCLRLLRMGIEFLREGKLNVWREDAAHYVAIKRGEVPLSDVLLEANQLFDEARRARDESTLPERAPHDLVSDMAMRVVYEALEERGELYG